MNSIGFCCTPSSHEQHILTQVARFCRYLIVTKITTATKLKNPKQRVANLPNRQRIHQYCYFFFLTSTSIDTLNTSILAREESLASWRRLAVSRYLPGDGKINSHSPSALVTVWIFLHWTATIFPESYDVLCPDPLKFGWHFEVIDWYILT